MPQERIDFSGLFNEAEHACYRVKGESMIDAHISEGDYIVAKLGAIPRDGDIVVANVEGGDAILKKFYREVNGVRLESANKTMVSIFSAKVDVKGVVVGVIRQY